MKNRAVFCAMAATLMVTGSVFAAEDGVAPGGAADGKIAENCLVCVSNVPELIVAGGIVVGGLAVTLSGNSGNTIHSSTTTATTTSTTTSTATTTPTTTSTTTTTARTTSGTAH